MFPDSSIYLKENTHIPLKIQLLIIHVTAAKKITSCNDGSLSSKFYYCCYLTAINCCKLMDGTKYFFLYYFSSDQQLTMKEKTLHTFIRMIRE